MPANMWDNSAIIMGDQRGANIGAGLSSGAASIAQALIRNAQERKRKEEEKKMSDYLDPILRGMSGGKITAKDAPKEALPMLYEQARTMEQNQRDAPIRAAQLKSEQLQQENLTLKNILAQTNIDQTQADAGASTIAAGGQPSKAQLGTLLQRGGTFASTTPAAGGDYLTNYLRAGGTPNREVADVAAAQRKQLPFMPQVVDAGGGTRAMTTSSSSAVPLKDPKADTLEVGGKTYKVGPGNNYFDAETGKHVYLGRDRPPVAPDFVLKSTDPELYQAMRQEYLDWAAEQKANPSAAAASPAGGEQKLTPEQAAKLPAGTVFVGTDGKRRVKQ